MKSNKLHTGLNIATYMNTIVATCEHSAGFLIPIKKQIT